MPILYGSGRMRRAELGQIFGPPVEALCRHRDGHTIGVDQRHPNTVKRVPGESLPVSSAVLTVVCRPVLEARRCVALGGTVPHTVNSPPRGSPTKKSRSTRVVSI
jgi:hypothetical protein